MISEHFYSDQFDWTHPWLEARMPLELGARMVRAAAKDVKWYARTNARAAVGDQRVNKASAVLVMMGHVHSGAGYSSGNFTVLRQRVDGCRELRPREPPDVFHGHDWDRRSRRRRRLLQL